ncbi:hypothetical protein OCK74_00135 [Chitinophagaceae bacterium LB-8]|jgi:hypothetical protein|uniref:Uncharacterized protein n=1 Tax=Paraflavisolibacter caeni TaxID=2982496 RepID=A0A9X2XS31_9BACT|nr:hypothetical protein [Paraflavisolibacter caeni]MCU7547495.1 hypothetical protein [Paraflavisolibacter caeni]
MKTFISYTLLGLFYIGLASSSSIIKEEFSKAVVSKNTVANHGKVNR